MSITIPTLVEPDIRRFASEMQISESEAALELLMTGITQRRAAEVPKAETASIDALFCVLADAPEVAVAMRELSNERRHNSYGI